MTEKLKQAELEIEPTREAFDEAAEVTEEAYRDIEVRPRDPGTAVMTMATETGQLLQIAMQNDKGIDVIERLIALRHEEEDRAARREFDFHFAEMQRKLKPVKKNKAGSRTTKGDVAFYYAPLEEIERLNKAIITKHGFSYRWRQENIEGSQDLRVRLLISGWGWTDDKTYFDVPPIPTNNLTTPVQARGAQLSYGKRNSFVAGFGISIEGEDNENLLPGDVLKYAEQSKRINDCQTMEELKQVFADMYHGLDIEGKTTVTKIYNEKKAVLNAK